MPGWSAKLSLRGPLCNASSSRRPILRTAPTSCGSALGTAKQRVWRFSKRKFPGPSSRDKQVVKLKKSPSSLTTRSREQDPAPWRLEVVDIHHNHTRSTPQQPRDIHGVCYLACTRRVGEVVATLDLRLSLRSRTVRASNRQREPEERLRFSRKNSIARAILKRIAPHLPEGWTVIVQFDSGYASNQSLKLIHRQKWPFTCGVRFNRNLEGRSLDTHPRKLKHKWHDRVSVSTAEGETRSFR